MNPFQVHPPFYSQVCIAGIMKAKQLQHGNGLFLLVDDLLLSF